MIHRSRLPDVEIPDLPVTSHVLAAAESRGGKPTLIDDLSGGPSSALACGAQSVRWPGPGGQQVLPYFSGTTGLAKGVVLAQRNLVANIAQTLAVTQIQPAKRLIAVLPFFPIYGVQILMNFGLRAGAAVVTLPRFGLRQRYARLLRRL
jgi:AMP-binding enzyme